MLYTLLQHGVETTVDRSQKNSRIINWIQHGRPEVAANGVDIDGGQEDEEEGDEREGKEEAEAEAEAEAGSERDEGSEAVEPAVVRGAQGEDAGGRQGSISVPCFESAR